MPPKNEKGQGDNFLGPGHYQIKVLGFLDSSWSNRLGGLTVHSIAGRGTSEETTLEGILPDQSALAGVLNALHELQLPVLSVQRLVK